MQRTIRRPEATPSANPFVLDASMFDRPSITEHQRPDTAERELRMAGSYKLATKISPLPGTEIDIAVSIRQSVPQISPEEYVRALAVRLCEKHRGISVNPRVLGGMPHIKGMRISVPHILTHLYHLGSIDAIVEEFSHRINKEQVREAIAYAHDFMEMACDPSEDDD